MIPFEHKAFVKKLRDFIGDRQELNKLLDDEENTDNFLYDCILDALNSINTEFSPDTTYKIAQVPWQTLKNGAVLQYLIGKGILSARNTLTYNDATNITVQDEDTYGRYLTYYNALFNKFNVSVTAWKMRKNIDECYGGEPSEFWYR